MANYLYRCGDGQACYYLDEDGGPDVMGYTLDAQWAFYLDHDRRNAYAPDGRALFYIDGNYFYDANGPAFYCDEEVPLRKGPPRLTDAQRRIVSRFAETVHYNMQSVFVNRVIALLKGSSKIDDAAVRRAAERARLEMGQPAE